MKVFPLQKVNSDVFGVFFMSLLQFTVKVRLHLLRRCCLILQLSICGSADSTISIGAVTMLSFSKRNQTSCPSMHTDIALCVNISGGHSDFCKRNVKFNNNSYYISNKYCSSQLYFVLFCKQCSN